MSIGALSFAQPFVLLGLLILPLIWRLLRASPPPAREQALPSLPLLEELVQHEESPEHTPWWLAALRLMLAALVIIAFAEPRFIRSSEVFADGPLLLVIDDGWPSASRWSEIIRAARIVIAEARNEGRAIQILRTASQKQPSDPDTLLDAGRADRLIRTLRPSAWLPNRAEAVRRLQENYRPSARIVWLCDGLQQDRSQPEANGASALTDALTARAPLQVQKFAPRGAYAIRAVRRSSEGPRIILQRAQAGVESLLTVSARSSDGVSLALTQAVFDADATETQAQFSLPSALMNRVARFELTGQRSAGAVWLREQADIRPRVGLVDSGNSGQPLLNAVHYARRALEPYAELSAGTLARVLEQKPDAIIVPDRQIHANNPLSVPLTRWIEQGGVLIRFAGPLLATRGDDFIPTPLRPAARALGGALAWEKPQKLAPPPETSPFAGIPPPDDAFIRRQVLAEPGPDLLNRTWARLEDGTPIVTANPRGQGMIVLFHITATPEWSDLPYTAAFVDMLRRASLSGQTNPQRPDQGGYLIPWRILNGFGEASPPHGDIVPVLAEQFADLMAGPVSPPGLYEGPSGHHALNAGIAPLVALNRFPADIDLIEGQSQPRLNDWRGRLLSLSLLLLISDIIASLALAGAFHPLTRNWRRWRQSAIGAGLTLTLLMASPDSAHAESSRVMEAALNLRLAYIQTDLASNDSVIRAGLEELGHVLFRRTAVELAPPHAVRPDTDPLELYPLIYFAPPPGAKPLNAKAISALNIYLRHGGALFIDTRDTVPGQTGRARLAQLLEGLDIPPLAPVPENHVIHRSFYLIGENYGRLQGGQLWLESDTGDGSQARGDGIAGIFIGGADWAGAWARDKAGRALLPMDGGEHTREYAYRFGVNLVMYVLTGNYKADQVHLPDLLKRLRRRGKHRLPEKPQ